MVTVVLLLSTVLAFGAEDGANEEGEVPGTRHIYEKVVLNEMNRRIDGLKYQKYDDTVQREKRQSEVLSRIRKESMSDSQAVNPKAQNMNIGDNGGKGGARGSSISDGSSPLPKSFYTRQAKKGGRKKYIGPRQPPSLETAATDTWTTKDVKRQMKWEKVLDGNSLKGWKPKSKSPLTRLLYDLGKILTYLYRRLTNQVYGLGVDDREHLNLIATEWSESCRRYRELMASGAELGEHFLELNQVPKFEEFCLPFPASKASSTTPFQTHKERLILLKQHQQKELKYTELKLARDLREFHPDTRLTFLMLWRRNHTIDMMRGYNRCVERLKMKQEDVETNIGPYSEKVKLPPMVKDRMAVEKGGAKFKSIHQKQNYNILQQQQQQHREHPKLNPQHRQGDGENPLPLLPPSTQSKNYDKHRPGFNGVDLE